MKFEKTIRILPPVFLGVAAISFIRGVLIFAGSWFAEERLTRIDPSHDMALSAALRLFAQALSTLVSPLGWVASAAILFVLLSIYDRVSK